MKIGIGNDHTAVDLKYTIKEYLESKGYEVVNYGKNTKTESVAIIRSTERRLQTLLHPEK